LIPNLKWKDDDDESYSYLNNSQSFAFDGDIKLYIKHGIREMILSETVPYSYSYTHAIMYNSHQIGKKYIPTSNNGSHAKQTKRGWNANVNEKVNW